MAIELEPWQLISGGLTLLIAFFAGLGGLFKVLYGQLDRRLARMDEARAEDMSKFRALLAEHATHVEQRLARIDHLDSNVQQYRNAQADRWEKVGDRVARVEQQQLAAIGHADLSHLHERINGLTRELAQLHGEVGAVNALVRTIDQYLRDQTTQKREATA